MKGTEYILSTFPLLGVNHLFMFVGGLVDNFLPDATSGVVTPIVACNESGAGYAADGYARATGKFGPVLIIGGPGAFNAVGGVGAACADKVPLLVLTGETSTTEQGLGSFQDSSGVGVGDTRVFTSLTGFTQVVPSPAALPNYLRVAYEAMLGRQMPVHLGVPMDVQKAEIGHMHLWQTPPSTEPPRILDETSFEEFGRAVLGRGTNLAILAGGGTLSSDAADELLRAAEELQIPVATTFRAKGAISEDHPLSLGMFGYAGHPPAEDCLTSGEVDGLLVLGSSLNQRDTLNWNARLKPRLGLAQVNLEADVLGRNFPVSHRVVGDVRTALRRLLDRQAPWAEAIRKSAPERRAWADGYLKRPRFLSPEDMTSDAVPIHPARIIAELRNSLPRDAALLIDSGAHRAFAGHYFPIYQPRRLFSATGLGPMGWALGASIGVAVALPGTRVAVVTGDGCMLQNGIEIASAARHDLTILYVVLNNSALGNVYLRAKQMGDGPRRLTELPTHHWEAFARSLGLRARTVSQPGDLAAAFGEFLSGPGPMLVDVRCDRDALTPVGPWNEAKKHPDIYAE